MNKSKYQLIIFDWDGTIVDSHAYICYCLVKASEKLGLPIPKESMIRRIIGLSLETALEQLFPNENQKTRKTLGEHYQNCFYKSTDQRRRLFSGARETLIKLQEKGYWLAVATGKDRKGLDREIIEYDLSDFFMITRTAEESRSKPHPLMLEQILEETGLSAGDALMVGDTDHDILMADAINMDTVLAAYGHPNDEYVQSLETSGKIDTISELISWLEAR